MDDKLTADSSNPIEPFMDSEKVQSVYQDLAVGLKRFLLGVLNDESAATDALQATFIKLMEKGHLVQQEDSIKSWLFRVAFNEAMLMRRRETMMRRHAERVAWKIQVRLSGVDGVGQSVEHVIRQEEMEMVRAALNELSPVQREVVEKRIYEGLKFREIAEQLNVPLGTVLARMQSSLKKLKPILAARTDWHD